jgi:hemerythrin
MKYLQWSEDYSIGIDAVDFEHQTLIEMINLIYAELEDRRDIDEIKRTIGDVHMEISAHFALEERIMRDGNYEEYAGHKNDHEDLLDQIRTMMDALDNDAEKAMDKLSEQLADWFSVHFATFDARMHRKFRH